MRYVRMLSNAAIAACLAASYVMVLFLQLNPALPMNPARLAPLFRAVGVFYAAYLTIGLYALLMIRQMLARDLFSPAWISVSVLVWLNASSAAIGSALMWANLLTFSLVLDGATAEAMT